MTKNQLSASPFILTLYSPAEVVSLTEQSGFEIVALERVWEDKIDNIGLKLQKPLEG